MNRLQIAMSVLIAATLAVLIGCGGGGGTGGGNATLIGRVLNIETGGAPNPSASIQGVSGAPSTSSDITDGSFSLGPVSNGTTQAKVIPNHPDNWPVFTFTFAAANDITAIGDLWVGPQQVTVHGRALSAATNTPIANATVTFGGQTGTTNASGVFDIGGVAYSTTTQAAFWGIVGSIRKTPDFFKVDFTASPHTADGSNVVDVGDILLTPANDPNPPQNTPYNITGRVLPINGSAGCIVTLKQGSTALRIYNVGTDGKYYFWIVPGTYDITFQKAAQTAPTQIATVTQPNQTITVPDVTLN